MMHQTAPSILRKGVGVGEDPSGGIHDTSNSTIDLEAGWGGGECIGYMAEEFMTHDTSRSTGGSWDLRRHMVLFT